jgi:uncharacterized protein (DUF2235 family)
MPTTIAGIGTYDVDATTVDQTWLGSFGSSLGNTMDQGFGAGFDAHVLAGYRFLMRYYESVSPHLDPIK